MKRLSSVVLLLFLLLPSLLWALNARSSQLGLFELEERKDVITLLYGVTQRGVPFYEDESLYLLSHTDPYVYRYQLGEVTMDQRFDMGGKEKVFIRDGDRLIAAFQRDSIYYEMIQVSAFDFKEEKVTPLLENKAVKGDVSKNATTKEGALYLWYHEGKDLFISKLQGVEIRTQKLPIPYEEQHTYGFNLDHPQVKTGLYFEEKETGARFHLDGTPFTEEVPSFLRETTEGVIKEFYQTEEGYRAISFKGIEESHEDYTVHNLLKDMGSTDSIVDTALARKETYRLETLSVSGEVLEETSLESYIKPFYQGDTLLPETMDLPYHEEVLNHYHDEALINQEEIRDFLTHDQLRSFLSSPTSLALILVQILFIALALFFFRGDRRGVLSFIEDFFYNKDSITLLMDGLALLLTLWALNPESIYYSWVLWAALFSLWLILVLYDTRLSIIPGFLKSKGILIVLWPAFTLILWVLGQGFLHRKFIAIALALLIPWYYLLQDRKKALAFIGSVGAAYASLIALVSVVQFGSFPDIARELAQGRGYGNYLASSLLGNFHSVYMAVPLSVFSLGLFIKEKDKKRFLYLAIALIQMLFLAFSRYSIALVALGLVLLLLLLSRWIKREKGMYLITLIGLGLGALLLLLLKGPLFNLIYRLDSRYFDISERLFNRLWVYFRSLLLYLKYPLRGYSQLRDASLLTGNHSDYLEILAEYGMIGHGVMVLSFFGSLYFIRKYLPKKVEGLYFIAIIGTIFVMLLNPVWEVSSVTMLTTILIGLGLTLGGHVERIQ